MMVKENTFASHRVRHHAWMMLLATLAFVCYPSTAILPVVALVSFSGLMVRGRRVWQPLSRWGGVGNAITSLRWLLTGGVAWLSPLIDHTLIFGLGVFILIADGLDGYYARKYHTVSSFGDLYDKETYAFFVLAYGAVIVQEGLAGEWVLLPGLLRYLFVIVLSLVKAKPVALRPSFRRRWAGMWLMGTLLACFVVPSWLYLPGLVFAIGFVLYSFAVDLYGMYS